MLMGRFPETGWVVQSAPSAVGSSVLVAPLSARLVFPLRLLCESIQLITISWHTNITQCVTPETIECTEGSDNKCGKMKSELTPELFLED